MDKNNISLIINCSKKDIPNIDINIFKNQYSKIYFNFNNNLDNIINQLETKYYGIWNFNNEYKNIDNIYIQSVNDNKQLVCIIINLINNDNIIDIGEQNKVLENIFKIYYNYKIFINYDDSYQSLISNIELDETISITKVNNIKTIDDIILNIEVYKFLNKTYTHVLYINTLNLKIFYNNLNTFIKLNYDLYGAPNEGLFEKKFNNKISSEVLFININNFLSLLNCINNKSIITFNKVTDINNILNIINVAPKYILSEFALCDFVEDYCQLFNIKLPQIAVHYYSYINEYNSDEFKNYFNNKGYNLYYGPKPKYINYYDKYIDFKDINVLKSNIDINYYNSSNYNISFKQFIYEATFNNINKVNDYIIEAEQKNQIPKIIHFCFVDYNDIPEKIQICIDSWRQHLHDYLFINWTPYIFNEINDFCTYSLKFKKNQFFADYVRLYALSKYGGIYLDSDIFISKSFDDLIESNIDYVFDEEINQFTYRLECGCMLTKKDNYLIYLAKLFYDNIFIEDNIDKEVFISSLLNNYVMPDIINKVIKDNNIKLVFNINTINEYKLLVDNNNNEEMIYVLNSTYLSSPQMQACGTLVYNYQNTYASHCFTNSYIK